MRSDREAVQRFGLRVKTPHEEFALATVNALEKSSDIGPCDLIVVALKTTANQQLESLVKPLLHEKTVILTLQNGLGSDEQLAALFGAERILGGLCFVCVNRTAPSEIVCLETGSISMGEFQRPAGDQASAVSAMFAQAGVKCVVGDDLAALRWKKLVWNIPFNGLAIAAGGITTDVVLANPDLERLARELMTEVIGAAAKLGHSIPLTFIDQQIESTRTMGAYKPSSLVDYLAGNEVEVDSIWGEPLRRAERAGARVPCLQMLHALIAQATKQRLPR
jgi:2-dehydropantoate 2-reductase